MPRSQNPVSGPISSRSMMLGALLTVLGLCLSSNVAAAPGPAMRSEAVSVPDAGSPRAAWSLLDPHRYFVTQFRSEWNSNESAGNNGNCGPTCVVMAAMAFARVACSPATASREVRTVRLLGTGRMNPGEATSVDQLAKGARHYGLVAVADPGSSMETLTNRVQAGAMAICCVAPHLIDASYHSSGHYVLVRAIDAAGVHISDPGRSLVYGGIRTVPLSQFGKAWKANDCTATFVALPPLAAKAAT